MTKSEKIHIERVKNQNCIVCDAAAPSDAHHVLEDRASGRKPGHFLIVPLCKACHQGPSGIHGDRALWKIYKMSEMEALNETLSKILGG